MLLEWIVVQGIAAGCIRMNVFDLAGNGQTVNAMKRRMVDHEEDSPVNRFSDGRTFTLLCSAQDSNRQSVYRTLASARSIC